MIHRRTKLRSAVFVFFAVVLLASLFTLSSLSVAAAEKGIHISDVEVSPDNPEVGETVTVTTTVKNDGAERFDLSQVRIMGLDDMESSTNLGTVAPGEEIDVPLSVRFESEGTKEFDVRASGTAVGIGTVHRQVTVEVSGNSLHVDSSAEDAVVGSWVPLDVELSNGAVSEVRNVRVDVDGDVRVRENTAYVPELTANRTEAVELLVMSDSPGTETVDVSVSYTNTNGNTVTVTDTLAMEFTEANHEVDLRATTTEDGIEATFLNLGDSAVQDVLVEGAGDVTPVEIDGVRGKSSETVALETEGLREEEEVELRASYYLGDERRTVETTVGYVPKADVRLTGTSVEGGSSLTVTGSASNVGIDDADGVLVEVVDTEYVEPRQPQPDYFVGTVPASDFGTFELNADVTGEVDAIPVEVSYTYEGERQSHVVEIPYVSDFAGEADTGFDDVPHPEDDDEGLPTYLVVLLAVCALLVVGYGWRRRGAT